VGEDVGETVAASILELQLLRRRERMRIIRTGKQLGLRNIL
jgi:hypothetical protein